MSQVLAVGGVKIENTNRIIKNGSVWRPSSVWGEEKWNSLVGFGKGYAPSLLAWTTFVWHLSSVVASATQENSTSALLYRCTKSDPPRLI